MKNRKTFKLDGRTKKELNDEMRSLAASYTPEWRFTEEDPDVGSVIGIIFNSQLEENINRLNQAVFNYRTEFVNMLGVSLLPANPACCIVLMTLADNTIAGTVVPHGTQLFSRPVRAEDEDPGNTEQPGTQDTQEPVIFETAHDVYITSSKLTDAFMVSAKTGTVIPLLGEMEPQDYFETEAGNAAGDILKHESEETVRPFRLFDFSEGGIEKNALIICHKGIFDVEGNNIYIKPEGSGRLLDGIRNGEFRFLYYTDDGLEEIPSVKVEGDTVTLLPEDRNRKIRIGDEEYSAVVLEARGPVTENLIVDSLTLSSSGEPEAPQFIGDTVHEAEKGRFLPLGDSISLFNECYIGHDGYLDKAGALISITWHQEYEETVKRITAQEEAEELKTIKRKPRVFLSDTIADTWADEVAVEYFNGFGWKRLQTRENLRAVFAGKNAGDITMSFICPPDMAEFAVSGFSGRAVRIQVTRADNCYMLPCVHHYPVIKDMKISYSYKSSYMNPDRCIAVYGTHKDDITDRLRRKEAFAVFARPDYKETALYLGFDRRFASGPVSLFFELHENTMFDGLSLKYEYSSLKGFKSLKVADRTGLMTASGTLMFMPPSDMAAVTIEGKKRVWLRISRASGTEAELSDMHPDIRNISLNAIECCNIETLDEEPFYITEPSADMSFSLNADNILSADVWVNESTSYTNAQMEEMLVNAPSDIKAERDFLGSIERFFVRWKEVNDFFMSEPSDRHYCLDRMERKIIFGDGIHVRIPKVTDGPAFKVTVRCCNGAGGNLPAGSVSDSRSNILFVNDISNPLCSFGGSNIESAESALERGGNILNARHRLISEADYIREIKSFSGNIDKVKCVTGLKKDGTMEPDAISIVVLMRDFREGSYSFHKEQDNLMHHLQQMNELSVTDEDLHIVEPVFVKISAEVWLRVPSMDDSFEIQSLYEKSLCEYLDPLSSQFRKGWDIGELVRYSQIVMRLNTIKSRAVMGMMSVTAEYRDASGPHVTDLKSLRPTPYMICCNGKHQIYISVQE